MFNFFYFENLGVGGGQRDQAAQLLAGQLRSGLRGRSRPHALPFARD